MPTIQDSSDEAEFEDEEELASPTRKRRASRGTVNYNEDDDDDDSDSEDDDIPLASLKSPSPAKTKKRKASEKKAPTKKAKTSSTKSTTKSTTTTNSAKTYGSASFALYDSGSVKGKLIQNLLCRWWYAYEWPDPASLPKVPPKNYDAMDGFPGVYICTQGDDVGTIKDFRDPQQSPNFNNFCRKSSEELKELLIAAIEKQTKQLVDADGQGTAAEKTLNTMLKWATKINAKKADKDANTILKASKLKIP